MATVQETLDSTTKIPETQLPQTTLDVEISASSEGELEEKSPRRSLEDRIKENPEQLDKAIFNLYKKTGLSTQAFGVATQAILVKIERNEYPTSRRKKDPDLLGKLASQIRNIYEGDDNKEERINEFLMNLLNNTSPQDRIDVLADKIPLEKFIPVEHKQYKQLAEASD